MVYDALGVEEHKAMYTVKQLSDLAQVSVRTLHYYDEIGLLIPSQVGANGYRYYDDSAVLRLQQILFYREIGMELMQIKDVLDSPNFDLITALKSHRALLLEKSERLLNLVSTVDSTIQHLQGEKTMSKRQLFEAFSDEKQKEYEREARLTYGPDKVNESVKRWAGYTQAQKEAIGNEGNQVYNDLVDAIEAGKSPTSEDVQAILQRWHDHLRYFYEPTLDILRGLGELYNTHPGFITNFAKIHPQLGEYMREGINQYVDDLEYAEIERMLSEDEARKHG
jgi:MerR family transcriptional regulator, thiopeptide resistance regulator